MDSDAETTAEQSAELSAALKAMGPIPTLIGPIDAGNDCHGDGDDKLSEEYSIANFIGPVHDSHDCRNNGESCKEVVLPESAPADETTPPIAQSDSMPEQPSSADSPPPAEASRDDATEVPLPPVAGWLTMYLKNKSAKHYAHDPKFDRPLHVLSFFVPHMCGLADVRVKDDAGGHKRLPSWNVLRDDNAWKIKGVIGERRPTYGPMFCGYDAEEKAIVVDRWTLGIMGIGESGVQSTYNPVWNIRTGHLMGIYVHMNPDSQSEFAKYVDSAMSVRKMSCKYYIENKMELDAKEGMLEWMMKKYNKETSKKFGTKRAPKRRDEANVATSAAPSIVEVDE